MFRLSRRDAPRDCASRRHHSSLRNSRDRQGHETKCSRAPRVSAAAACTASAPLPPPPLNCQPKSQKWLTIIPKKEDMPPQANAVKAPPSGETQGAGSGFQVRVVYILRPRRETAPVFPPPPPSILEARGVGGRRTPHAGRHPHAPRGGPYRPRRRRGPGARA